MTKSEIAERTSSLITLRHELSIVLWRQWRLEYGDHSLKAWDFFHQTDDCFMPFGFRGPRGDGERQRYAESKEPALIALAAVVNQFFARYTLPEVPDGLDFFVEPFDLGEEEELEWEAKRPQQEPDDWYLHIAKAMGLTEDENWAEIDRMVRWINDAMHPEKSDWDDRSPDKILAATLCALSSHSRRPSEKFTPDFVSQH